MSRPGEFLQTLAHLVAIHARHADIQQDQVGGLCFYRSQGACAPLATARTR